MRAAAAPVPLRSCENAGSPGRGLRQGFGEEQAPRPPTPAYHKGAAGESEANGWRAYREKTAGDGGKTDETTTHGASHGGRGHRFSREGAVTHRIPSLFEGGRCSRRREFRRGHRSSSMVPEFVDGTGVRRWCRSSSMVPEFVRRAARRGYRYLLRTSEQHVRHGVVPSWPHSGFHPASDRQWS